METAAQPKNNLSYQMPEDGCQDDDQVGDYGNYFQLYLPLLNLKCDRYNGQLIHMVQCKKIQKISYVRTLSVNELVLVHIGLQYPSNILAQANMLFANTFAFICEVAWKNISWGDTSQRETSSGHKMNNTQRIIYLSVF